MTIAVAPFAAGLMLAITVGLASVAAAMWLAGAFTAPDA